MLKTIVSIRYWNIQHPFSTIPSSFILKNHVHLFLMLMNLINIFSAFREIFVKVVFIFISLYMYIYMWVYFLCVEMPVRSQKKALDPPVLELEAIVSLWMWMLGITLRSSGRSASTFNCWVISPCSIERFYLTIVAFICYSLGN